MRENSLVESLRACWSWLWSAPAKPTSDAPVEEELGETDDEPVEEPIGDTLDLHFWPGKLAVSVTEEYLLEARRLGFREVRVIHGRGKGILRQRVLALLARHPAVRDFDASHIGSTLVVLKGAKKP